MPGIIPGHVPLVWQVMGLVRLAIIGAVGISLLPSDREQQAVLFSKAANAATWTLTFCDRNAETCDKATVAWAEFRKKAEFGAGLAYDLAKGGDKAPVPVDTASITVIPPAPKRGERLAQRQTLTASDLQPSWRGMPQRVH